MASMARRLPYSTGGGREMDPNKTLQDIDSFLARHQVGDEVDDMCQDLFDWIKRGGFEPSWSLYPLGSMYYECRRIYMVKGAL